MHVLRDKRSNHHAPGKTPAQREHQRRAVRVAPRRQRNDGFTTRQGFNPAHFVTGAKHVFTEPTKATGR